MSVFLFIIFSLCQSTYANENQKSTDEKPYQKACAFELKACSQLKSIDIDRIKLAKENKNPTAKDKEDLLILTRCLFKEEVPTSEVCKTGLQQTVSSMTWFQRRIFNNFIL